MDFTTPSRLSKCFTIACMVDFDPRELVSWLTLTFPLWRSFVTTFMITLHGVPLLKTTFTSTPVKKLHTLNYFVLQLQMRLQISLFLEVSPCHHLTYLIPKPRTLSTPNIFFEVLSAYNLVGFNFHFSHHPFMTFGLLKTSCHRYVCLHRSFHLPSPRVLHFLLSSSLMMDSLRGSSDKIGTRHCFGVVWFSVFCVGCFCLCLCFVLFLLLVFCVSVLVL